MATTIVADNGAYSLRAGFSSEPTHRLIVPNQTAIIRNDGRELVADETEAADLKHHEMLEYRRAHQRGSLLDNVVEEKVWTRVLSQLGGFTLSDSRNLIVTEPPVTPAVSKKLSDELFFEKLKFDKVARVCSQACTAVDYQRQNPTELSPLVMIVIDCGYSATWIVPVVEGNACFPTAAKRVDVGGKLLTNLLKEELTWRHVNVMDDTHLVEKCKRDVCYVAKNWKLEKPSFVDYLLPDNVNDSEGRLVQSGEQINRATRQIMRITQERINIPEVLFNPSRIALDEAGIAEALHQCVSDLSWELRESALSNVIVCGGSARFPGFFPRLSEELKEYGCKTVVDWTDHYQHSAWKGAAYLANSSQYSQFAVTRQRYEEEGSQRLNKKRRGIDLPENVWWSVA